MKNRTPLLEQYFHIMEQVKDAIDEDDFREVHGMSKTTAWRILNCKTTPQLLETIDYMVMHCGWDISLKIEKQSP